MKVEKSAKLFLVLKCTLRKGIIEQVNLIIEDSLDEGCKG